ncbi:MAG TPA: CHRD domain-containing protein [Gemmatimonadales bacterium]
MRKAGLSLILGALAAACEPASSDDMLMTDVRFSSARTPTGAASFVAPASGGEEVPARDTRGHGTAVFHLNSDGTELEYRLIASNIENVVQAHIHLEAPGVNGPIVVFLYGLVAPGGGRTDGILAEGTITVADLTGPLTGEPFSALLDAIRAGNAYVNIHTNDGIDPPNTGPGDFPGGEVRGQIKGGHVDH